MTVQYAKIMITLDGSTFAAQALPHAQALAEFSGAQLILFQVVQDASAFIELMEEGVLGSDQRQQHLADEAMARMGQLIEEYELHQIDAEAVVEVGLPAETIIDYATEEEIDLIVMSTHGRTGLARWVYGSVADKVLKAAPCPVLLVRAALD